MTVISGFHSLVEQECLAVLLRGPQPVIVCPARGLARMRLKREYKEPMVAGRLLQRKTSQRFLATGKPRLTPVVGKARRN